MTIVTRRQLLLVSLGLSVLLFGFSAPAQSKGRGAAKPRVVVKAIDTAGLTALIKPTASRPLLVNYWATWCEPCREEFPDLVKIDNEYRPKGLDFIAVSLDDFKDIKTEVPKFLRQMRARMPVYLLNVSDPEPAIKAVDRDWGGALPATFLYNQKGEVVFKKFGPLNVAELRVELEKIMGTTQ
ncbi:MAG TPA: TlpA disulfide reductase family protein [Pyrinomonadaceae bacterium]|nr:TlpA disulfide reductase family protein [Pyrinomonadaceae bacterium]